MSINYGDWRVVRKIGAGSFGIVCEINRETMGFIQKAALKVISIPQSQSDVDSIRSTGMDEASIAEYYKDLTSQIMTELKTMDKLKGHTNIVSYEDHEIRKKKNGIGWDIYIRMELLTPLPQYLRDHSLSRREIICLGIDLCRALERCEALNIIHRDIKPDNIFLSEMGDGKLGDFGIARTVERTMSGLSKKGTYTFMAPEVYMGKPYGKTVDIYSLGLVLYQLLNYNRGPFLPAYPNPIKFHDQEEALMRRIKGEPIPAPAQADKNLAEVVLKACSHDPEQRYSSAEEMRFALQDVLDTLNNAGDSTEKRSEEVDDASINNKATDDLESSYDNQQKERNLSESDCEETFQESENKQEADSQSLNEGTISLFHVQDRETSMRAINQSVKKRNIDQMMADDRTVSVFKRSAGGGISKTLSPKGAKQNKQDSPTGNKTVHKDNQKVTWSHNNGQKDERTNSVSVSHNKWSGLLRASVGAAIGGAIYYYLLNEVLLIPELLYIASPNEYEVYLASVMVIPILSWVGYQSTGKLKDFAGMMMIFIPAAVAMLLCVLKIGFDYPKMVRHTLGYFGIGNVPALIVLFINRRKIKQ